MLPVANFFIQNFRYKHEPGLLDTRVEPFPGMWIVRKIFVLVKKQAKDYFDETVYLAFEKNYS